MSDLSREQALDRHVLVTAIWLALGFTAAILYNFGIHQGGPLFILAGNGVILSAFVGHVIVNAIYATTFSPRELALGLVLFAAALVAFGLATLIAPDFGTRNFLPFSVSFIAVGACIVFYMITHFGIRRVFEAFDTIRDFKPAEGSTEPDRRGDESLTVPLASLLGILAVYALYIASMSARSLAGAGQFLDGGMSLPTWVLIFGGAGVVLATLGLHDHLLLLASYGLQYNQVTVALILVAIAAALVHKRAWLASRITGFRTSGDLLGEYYGSTTIRLYLLAILFLFSVPFAAYCLVEYGALIDASTGGVVPVTWAVWSTAFFLFLCSAIGGWRGVAYLIAALSLLMFALLFFIGGFVGVTFDDVAFAAEGISTKAGILPDKIPGVIQFTSGIGKELPAGGVWTTISALTFGLSLIGIVLSPGFFFLSLTTTTRRGLAFQQVWMTAGIAAGVLMLIGPILSAEIGTAPPEATAPWMDLVARLGALDQLAATAFVMLLAVSLLIAIAFFAGSGANIVTIEMVGRFVLPELTGSGLRLAARIALAAIYLAVAVTASFAPLGGAIFSSVAVSLAAQLMPAFLGLCWASWVSRSGVITGLIFGTLGVVFTEPFGLVIFERLFVDLPWGRWPLTVHSAGWGLFLNFGACLLVSLFTRSGAERAHRDRLHEAMAVDGTEGFGGRASRTAKWSLILIWAFLALGPGAILGNTFFSEPIFAGVAVAPGLPSLLIWQIIFWFLGVLLVWWLAYQGRISVIDTYPHRTLTMRPPTDRLFEPITTPWISRFLGRMAGR